MFVHSTGTVADPLNTHRALIYKNLAGQRDDRTNRERIAAAERSAAQDVMANLAMTGADVDLGKLEMGQRAQQMKDAFGLDREKFEYGKEQDIFNQKSIAENVYQEASAASDQYNTLIDHVSRMPASEQAEQMMRIEQMINPKARMLLEKDENNRWRPNKRVTEGYRVFYPENPMAGFSGQPGFQQSQSAPQSSAAQPTAASLASDPDASMLWNLIRKGSSGGAVGLATRGYNMWRNRAGAQQPESTNAPQRRFTPNHGLEILR